MSSTDARTTSAAEDRWCHEVSPHDAHAWSESGQAYLCDGVPRDDAQTPSAASPSPAYVAWYGRGRKQNWTTPPGIFDPLHDEYDFTLDGASEPGNGLLPRASTVETPMAWEGERVFCNPPWSNIAPFVELAASADLAVLLVPARTNARWFHRALELGATVRYFLGRPSFESGPEGQKGHNSPVDCVLLVFDRFPTTAEVAA